MSNKINLCIYEGQGEYICTAGHVKPRHECKFADIKVDMRGDYDIVECKKERGVFCHCRKAQQDAKLVKMFGEE